MVDRTVKLSVILVNILIISSSLLYLATNSSGEIFPYVPAFILVVITFAITFSLFTPSNNSTIIIGLSFGAISSILLITLSFAISGSLIGIDTDGFALRAFETALTGDLQTGGGFYGAAPIFHGWISIIWMLTSLDIFNTIVVVSVVIISALTLFSYLIGLAVSKSHRVGVLSAVMASVLAVNLVRSYWPIATSVGMVLFFLFCYILFRSNKMNTSHSLVALMLLFAMLFTHKILLFTSLLFVLALSVGRIVRHSFYRKSRWKKPQKIHDYNSILIFIPIIIILWVVQWFYLTNWGAIGLRDFLITLGFDPTLRDITRDNASMTMAVPIERGILWIFSHEIHALSFLAIGGIAWIWIAYHRTSRQTDLLFVTAAMVSIALLMGIHAIIGDSPRSPRRIFTFSGIFLTVLISVFTFVVIDSSNKEKLTKLAFSLLFFVIIFLQVFSTAAVIDHPGHSDLFLRESEVEGKEFSEKYIHSTIYADQFFRQERVDFLEEVYYGVDLNNRLLSNSYIEKYYMNEPCLFQRDCSIDGKIILRPENEVYRVPPHWQASQAKLIWEPSKELGIEMNQIYDSKRIKILTGLE